MNRHLINFLLIVLILSSSSYHVLSQSSAPCHNYQTGKFMISNEISGVTIIKRTKKKQIEYSPNKAFKSKSDVVWISDCTYELRNTKLIKGPETMRGKPTDVLTVVIKETTDKYLIVSSTSNYSDLVRETKMHILK